MSQPERILWSLLRRGQSGLHFRRQHPVGPFILDFYCASARLCVEIDGPVHADQAERDEKRTKWLEKEGIRVLRFSTGEIEARPAAVLAAIAQAAPPSTA
jgi:very-short-patch-repair endonuclease